MRYLLAVIAVLASTSAYAETPKQAASREARLAKAEQTAVMASCKFEALKKNVGKTSSPAYFSFMAECLTRSAAR